MYLNHETPSIHYDTSLTPYNPPQTHSNKISSEMSYTPFPPYSL